MHQPIRYLVSNIFHKLQKRRQAIFICCFVLLLPLMLHGQTYPVDCRVLLSPPYSGNLTDYANSPTKFRVQLLLRDLTKTSLEVSLRIRLKSATGVWIENPEGFIASTPITLSPGVPRILSGAELFDNFNPNNLEAQGIDLHALYQGEVLPVGPYQWEVFSVELYRNRQVSNIGSARMTINANYAPLLSMPRNEAVLSPSQPQNILFSWTPRHTASPALGVKYTLFLYEISDDDVNIQAVVNSGIPPFRIIETTQPNYLYGATEVPLQAGKRYAWQVKVEDLQGKEVFQNDGFSNIQSFSYGKTPCLAPENLVSEIETEDGKATGAVKFSWKEVKETSESHPIAYILTYKQEGGLPTEVRTSKPEYLLLQQETGKNYEWKVQSVCGVGDKSTFSPNETFNIPTIEPESWYSDPELSYQEDPEPQAEPDVMITNEGEGEGEGEENTEIQIEENETINVLLNTPIKIFIPAEGEENLPEGIPASLPVLPENSTVEQLQAALKTKKPTCSGIVSTYSCGNHDTTPAYSGAIVPINTGDEIAMNSLVLSVVSIDGSGNGSGLIKIPMMNNIKLGVTLNGIQVAEGGCVVAGKAELSGISASVLTEQQRANLEKAYAVFNQIIDAGIANAGTIAETYNNLKDFIQKAKDFVKNYKGGKTDAKKAKIYEEYAKNAQKVLLNSKNLPASIRADLESKIVAAQPAWDFFKTGNKCNGTSSGKGGPNFEDYSDECEAFSAAIIAEMDAMEAAEGSFTCNCSPIGSECSPIKDILSQIKEANSSKKEFISISKADNKDKLSNDTDWISALNGIDIRGKCFKLSLEFKFSGDKIDLKPNRYKETKDGFDLVDEKGNTLLSINILNESGQSKYLKQAILKEYLGFEEEEGILTIKIFSDGKVVKYVPKNIQTEYKKQYNDASFEGKSFPIKYLYYDESNKKTEIGTYNYFLIKNPKKDKRWSDKLVTDLIDIRQIQQKGYKIWFDPNQNSSKRFYLNPCALGGIIGACIEVGFNDIDFRGFSQNNGRSGTSKTHFNGYYGDFGYFCKDESRHSLSLMEEENHTLNGISYYGWAKLDETRQNKFNDALFKFGWINGFWSWKYNEKFLNHSTQLENHHHHLHLKYYYKCINNNCVEYEK